MEGSFSRSFRAITILVVNVNLSAFYVYTGFLAITPDSLQCEDVIIILRTIILNVVDAISEVV